MTVQVMSFCAIAAPNEREWEAYKRSKEVLPARAKPVFHGRPYFSYIGVQGEEDQRYFAQALLFFKLVGKRGEDPKELCYIRYFDRGNVDARTGYVCHHLPRAHKLFYSPLCPCM